MKRVLIFLLIALCLSRVEAQIDDWPCPSVRVIRPNGAFKPGEIAIFKAEVKPTSQEIKYKWEVSEGLVQDGDRTSTIRVQISNGDPYAVTAVVVVEGLPKGCNPSGHASLPIFGGLPEGDPIDEFSVLKPNDVRARFDTFFQELTNNPTNQGFVVLRTSENEKVGITNSRLQLIIKHTKFRKFDLHKIDFAFVPYRESSTVLWRVPPGARLPDCDRCYIVKGSDIK
jgi:hypothetical protein